MAYFDVRPSAHVPTVELRVFDSCPNADDAVLIAGLFRGLVEAAAIADERCDRAPGRDLASSAQRPPGAASHAGRDSPREARG